VFRDAASSGTDGTSANPKSKRGKMVDTHVSVGVNPDAAKPPRGLDAIDLAKSDSESESSTFAAVAEGYSSRGTTLGPSDIELLEAGNKLNDT
jgi:hypothetical protein